MSIKNFFNPRAVAVVGASSNKEKIGRQILDNIIAGGFKGDIFPINLKEKKIASKRVFASLSDLPKKIYPNLLVVIAIPAEFVVNEVERCGQLGIKNIIIISAGFGEIGLLGEKREEQLKTLAQEFKLNILGPNCLGFISSSSRLNASFSGQLIENQKINQVKSSQAKIALLSQSGAVGSAALDWLKGRGLSLSCFISLGNKAVLSENDFLEYLISNKEVDAICLYLEDIKDGLGFMSLVSKAAASKPVIVLKSGLSSQGSALARSHTGALVSSSAVVSAGLARAGALLVDNLEDLFNLLVIMQSRAGRMLTSNKLRLITNAGGLAVLSADEAARLNLNLVASDDILGDADDKRYYQAVIKALQINDGSNILVLLTPQAATKPLLIAQRIVEIAARYKRRLIAVSFVGGPAIAAAKQVLAVGGVPYFDYPGRAIKALAYLSSRSSLVHDLPVFVSNKLIGEKRKKLFLNNDYLKLFSLLRRFKIPVVTTVEYENRKKITLPAVLKAVGPDFIHKTDKGGVILNLQTDAALAQAAKKLEKRYRNLFKKEGNYLVVQKQLPKTLELIIGLKNDDVFGPVLLVGLGGIYAEVFKQTKLVVADLNLSRAEKFISTLPFFSLLTGARGQEGYDVKALARVLVSLSELAKKYPEIKELDINPLFLNYRGAIAADVRAFGA